MRIRKGVRGRLKAMQEMEQKARGLIKEQEREAERHLGHKFCGKGSVEAAVSKGEAREGAAGMHKERGQVPRECHAIERVRAQVQL